MLEREEPNQTKFWRISKMEVKKLILGTFLMPKSYTFVNTSKQSVHVHKNISLDVSALFIHILKNARGPLL